ncbi:50S ribosomal protein acetyltransferase [Candidatus Phaeomarinobacter ectocarpi]|uniref:50S ribosomal protein acetyltransferase n=1 Tax=Candidatus Phaeomarinibacter ectocarpi TaxID=1458461 RepID=X5MMQ6_9HYPH|nr:GNAT family N-acetyltransferase [Candidatus Phaeomarinobacter ectocarpi]CDO59441.1 50S ribosomal protein acetyltransferase [Candidatus Phaeomarinobacter ectocarpi]
MRAQMKTKRLELRWITMEDAPRLTELADNWNVARMLARLPYPYPENGAEDWIATHSDTRARGKGSPYAIVLEGALIGVVGIELMDNVHAPGLNVELGYWLGEPYWGHGYATEAAQAAVTIGFADLGVGHLTSGHFEENAASGSVLTKCGFEYSGKSKRHCLARGEDMPSLDLVMTRDRWIDGLVQQRG